MNENFNIFVWKATEKGGWTFLRGTKQKKITLKSQQEIQIQKEKHKWKTDDENR